MNCPSLIQRTYTPTENLTSHPDTTVDKINESAIVDFKYLHLKELHALDFSTQHLHDWATQISPNTGIDLVDWIKLPKLLINYGKYISKSTGTDWWLMYHIPLLPLWGRSKPIDNTRHEDIALRTNMSSYYTLSMRWLSTMSDSIEQESSYKINLIPTFRQYIQ